MRIMWYVERSLTFAGGGERLLLEGLRYFANRGCEAVLYTNRNPVSPKALFDGRYSPKTYPEARNRSFQSLLSNFPIIHPLLLLFYLAKDIRSFRPDIVVANSQPEAWMMWKYNLIFPKKIPYVCFIHGSFFQFADDHIKYASVFRSRFDEIWNGDAVYREVIPHDPPHLTLLHKLRLEKNARTYYWGVHGAHTIFVLTNKNKKEIELLYQHSSVIVAHGAFSSDSFAYTAKSDKKAQLGIVSQKMILSLCRLVAKKRVELIIKGFALYLASNKEGAVLVIGGTGPERESLEKLARECGIERKVRFIDFIDEKELLDFYCSSDIFANADNADYDITTFVALALGVKVVVSSQHEFDQSAFKLNLLFNADPSPQGFARAFNAAISCEISSNAEERRTLLETYTWEYYFEYIRSLLSHIVS